MKRLYLAKPVKNEEGLYEYHVKGCIDIFNFEIKNKYSAFEKVLSKCNVSIDEFIENMRNAIAFHDFGKLNNYFQDYMNRKANEKKLTGVKHFRHEVLSCLFLIEAFLKKENKNVFFPYDVLSVLGHHKILTKDLKSFEREILWDDKWPDIPKEAMDLAVETAKSFGAEVFSEYKIQNKQIANKVLKAIIEKSSREFEKDRKNLRVLYSLSKGLLHNCDWISSSTKNEYEKAYTLNTTPSVIENNLKNKLKSENKKYVKRRFHKLCAESKGSNIVIAPTGSGKTEAALMWALNLKPGKVIFLMPTMVTSNSLYERLSTNYFPSEICGLTHSGAETYFFDKLRKNDEEETYDKFAMLHQKAFLPPVMVSTVDQLLTTGFNTGFWTQKEYALLGSSVIFDEIHAYDSYTIGLITSTVKKILDFGGKVLLMSATMPEFLKKHFLNLLGLKNAVVAEEFMDRVSNEWIYIDKDLPEIRENILEEISNGKKTALIVNDIETAKKEYKFFSGKGIETLCLHSEFTLEDRNKKEKILTQKDGHPYQLIISTQVIEVSLDISFDVMFSECAPIDSLVQRAGRCNRHGLIEYGRFYVFNPSEISLKWVYKRQQDIMEKTKDVLKNNTGKLSENDIASLVEEVYKDFDLYNEDYNSGAKIFDEILQKHEFFDLNILEEDEKLLTRKSDIIKIPIIPANQYKEKVEEHFIKKQYKLIPLYEVPVSINKFKKYIQRKIIDNKFKLPLFSVDYNSDYGIDYEKEEETSFFSL